MRAAHYVYRGEQNELSSFQDRDTKLGKYLAKNPHTKRKLLYFVNTAESPTIGHHFRRQRIKKIRVVKNTVRFST